MTKHCGLLIMALGLGGMLGCAETPPENPPQDPVRSDGSSAVIPGSTVVFARAAVEVGKIKIAQMPAYEATVEQLDTTARTALWQTLEQLHGAVHPSKPATSQVGGAISDPSGCSTDHCSHSDTHSWRAQWCCAFGEDALFFMEDAEM